MPDVYLYCNASLTKFSCLTLPELAAFTERHRIQLPTAPLQPTENIFEDLERSNAAGAVIALDSGWPRLDILRFSRKVLSRGQKIFFYWPGESALERVDG